MQKFKKKLDLTFNLLPPNILIHWCYYVFTLYGQYTKCIYIIWSVHKNQSTTLFTEAVSRRCSLKKLFLKILQNSQENATAGVSFFSKVSGLRPTTLLEKRIRHKCFPVNFAKFLRALILQNTSGRLILYSYNSADLSRWSCPSFASNIKGI